MNQHDEMVAWIRAQLDEAERVAHLHEDHDGVWVCPECGGGMTTAQRLDDHLFAFHGNRPGALASQLHEVEAKRRILDRCIQARADQGIYGEDGQEYVAEDVLKLLALPYAGRPGYRSEWAPSGD